MTLQIPLNIGLRENYSFENFFVGANSELVHCLQQIVENPADQFVYLWGANGLGKTHLLQAVCHSAANKGYISAYLPLGNSHEISPDMLEGLEQLSMVVIDDIQAIAGDLLWEEALFHLYNRLRESGTALIISGNVSPANIVFGLSDLGSRLVWGLVVQVKPLNDEGKKWVLQKRADQRGFSLSDDIAHYLLKYCPRDMASLLNILDQLEHASLAAQRKLTIPFIKTLICQTGNPSADNGSPG